MYRVLVEQTGCETEIVRDDIERLEDAFVSAGCVVLEYLPLVVEVQVWQIDARGWATCVLHLESGRGLQTNSSRCH